MENPVQALRALQEIDRDLHRVREELKRLPADRARRAAELEARRVRITQVRQRAMEHQVRIREIEDVTHIQRERVRKLEKESTSSRDRAVVEACRYEIKSLRRQIDEAEHEGLGLVDQVEGCENLASQLSEELAAEEAAFEEYCRGVESELAEAQGRHDDLAARRAARLSATLAPDTLALYDRLLDARGGEAMATLSGGICQVCFMEVPPNLLVRLTRGREVIQCPSCDRILHLP